MSSLFAPPELLSAYSYAVDGNDPEEPLRKGSHLRVFAGLGGSFPLAPFAVFKVTSRGSESYGQYYTDEWGAPLGRPDLSTFGPVKLTPLFGDTERRRTVRVELHASPADGIEGAQVLDQQGRVIAERRRPRFVFSAPLLPKFRVWGSADWVSLTNRIVEIDDVLSFRQPLEAADLLGLPIQGCHPWYVGVHDRQRALARVESGAPMRLNAMDQPDGSLDLVDADAEVARVEAMLASGRFGGGLEQLIAATVDEEGTVPWEQREKQPLNGNNQLAVVPRLGSMQLAALDPGVARFLGFAGRIDDLPDLERGEGWTALAVVGLLAIDPRLADRMPLLALWLNDPDPDEPALVEMITRAIRDRTGNEPECPLDKLIDMARQRGLLARAAVTVTAPVPPWLAPTLPEPAIVEHRWQAADSGEPSSLHRATFTFPHAPLAAMVAVAGNFDGTWASRHGTVDVNGFTPPTRATPRVFGHESESTSRIRQSLAAGSSASLQPAGLVADQDLPADAGTLTYRFRASDFFGRFGDPVETTIDPPQRPSPPPPVIRYELDLLQDDLETLPPEGKLSPGVLRLTFAVSADDEGAPRTAIAVPGISELAAGSLPIETATVIFDGVQQPDVVLTEPGLYSIVLPLPELDPQGREDLALTAVFTDAGGADSEAATVTVGVADKRPPTPIESGVGLFWTSAAGPAPDVQLQLVWQGPGDALYRIYATDRQGLGLTDIDLAEHVPSAAPSRGRIAEVGANKVLGGAHIDKRVFRLLTDTVKADPAGQAVLRTTLPRSLETVQFLRMVPLSPEGAEAPFDRCGIVPVAVPDTRRPPLPRLDGSVDPTTGQATLVVTADGFDGVALRRDEPGLFDPRADGAVAPTFRIRRAVGAIADPIYAREVTHGTLAHDATHDPDVVFTGTATDGNDGRGLEPFVRYVYWADVRLPPERRLPVGVAPIDAGFTALDPANAADYPRPMSLPSAPRTLMRLPADPPDAPAEATISPAKAAGPGAAVELTIEIADPPTAHPTAIGPYRLAAWTQWPGEAIQVITNADGAQLNGGWPDISGGSLTVTVAPPATGADPNGPIAVRLAYVDPAGRLGDLTTVSVA